jgi:hypothetical protein
MVYALLPGGNRAFLASQLQKPSLASAGQIFKAERLAGFTPDVIQSRYRNEGHANVEITVRVALLPAYLIRQSMYF